MVVSMRKAIRVALVVCALASPFSAHAEINLVFGIYAPDKRINMMWQCGSLVAAMEEHMSATLKKPVLIEVDINLDYSEGVDDVTAGLVDFARFPNVERGWVIHPDVDDSIVDAWRRAFVALNFERLPFLMNPDVFVEGSYGYCNELERLAKSAHLVGENQN